MVGYPLTSIQPSPPSPPENAALCRLYMAFRDLLGNPRHLAWLQVQPFVDMRLIALSGNVSLDPPKRVYSDREGYVQIDLPRGARVLVTVERHPACPFTVPDLDVAPLLQHLYPYPIRSFFAVVTDAAAGEFTELEVVDDAAEVPVGTQLGLAVEWSNGTLDLLVDPGPMTWDGEPLDIQASVVELLATGSGTLHSALDDLADTLGKASLWELVGYSTAGAPLHVPNGDAFTLAPDVVLTVV